MNTAPTMKHTRQQSTPHQSPNPTHRKPNRISANDTAVENPSGESCDSLGVFFFLGASRGKKRNESRERARAASTSAKLGPRAGRSSARLARASELAARRWPPPNYTLVGRSSRRRGCCSDTPVGYILALSLSLHLSLLCRFIELDRVSSWPSFRYTSWSRRF